jgi:hypothetical protein
MVSSDIIEIQHKLDQNIINKIVDEELNSMQKTRLRIAGVTTEREQQDIIDKYNEMKRKFFLSGKLPGRMANFAIYQR